MAEWRVPLRHGGLRPHMRGGRTQIFGGKTSEPEITRPVKDASFIYLTCTWRPVEDDPIGISPVSFAPENPSPCAIVRRYFCDV